MYIHNISAHPSLQVSLLIFVFILHYPGHRWNNVGYISLTAYTVDTHQWVCPVQYTHTIISHASPTSVRIGVYQLCLNFALRVNTCYVLLHS